MPNSSSLADSQSIDYFNYEDQDYKLAASNTSKEAGKSPEALLQLQEWTQIVYCASTSFLILDFIFRRRNNGVGVHYLKWAIILVVSDILPLFYICSKTQFFQYTELMPKPLAVYHALVLLMLTACSGLLFVIVFCMPCCCVDSSMLAQPRDTLTSRQPFSRFTLTRIALFVLVTVGFQYTGVYMVSMDIAAKMVDTDKAMSMMIKFKGVVELGMNVHKWSTILRLISSH
uniref:G protein-coupled receptor n=1 Tax=Ditylenchus dipsaci TaxID=166011 RepID=A0A915DNX2_9BILA